MSEWNHTMVGSTTSTTKPIPARCQASSARKVARSFADSQSTMLPRKENIQTSVMAISAIRIVDGTR